MITRIGIVGLVVATAFAVSGLGASAASATDICELALLRHGNFDRFGWGGCNGYLPGRWEGWWFNYFGSVGKKLTGSEYCSQLGEGEGETRGEYTDSECTTKGEGKFIKAKLALPDVQPALEGASYPITIERTLLSTMFAFETAASKASGSGGLLLLLSIESSSLVVNSFDARFLKVEFEKSQCNTSGAAAGEVSTTGTVLIARLSKTSSAIGLLLEPSEIQLECGLMEIRIKGTMLGSLSAGEEATELQSASLTLDGSKGKPEVTKIL